MKFMLARDLDIELGKIKNLSLLIPSYNKQIKKNIVSDVEGLGSILDIFWAVDLQFFDGWVAKSPTHGRRFGISRCDGSGFSIIRLKSGKIVFCVGTGPMQNRKYAVDNIIRIIVQIIVVITHEETPLENQDQLKALLLSIVERK